MFGGPLLETKSQCNHENASQEPNESSGCLDLTTTADGIIDKIFFPLCTGVVTIELPQAWSKCALVVVKIDAVGTTPGLDDYCHSLEKIR
jgi:hypothetical protein